MKQLPDMDQEPQHHPRWRLIRNLAVFQVKLVIDGLRDLVMSPISLVAALAGLLAHRNDPDRYFRRIVRLGAESERWINLFGRPVHREAQTLDELFGRLERKVVEQYELGGLTAHAKHAIDRSLDSVHRQVDRVAAGREISDGGQAAPPADNTRSPS